MIRKVGSTSCAAAAIVCMAEYPCVERSEKLEDDLQLADCNARFRHYQDCVYFLIVTFSTVGYGDMYPATRLGKGVVVFVLLFVLCFLPSLLSDIAELSDGDDTSAEEQQINAVAALHEAVLDLHEDVEHLAAGFEALGALAAAMARRKMQLNTKLEPGSVALVDNWRVAHVRESYVGGRRRTVGSHMPDLHVRHRITEALEQEAAEKASKDEL